MDQKKDQPLKNGSVEVKKEPEISRIELIEKIPMKNKKVD
jgi:hypothetical protein